MLERMTVRQLEDNEMLQHFNCCSGSVSAHSVKPLVRALAAIHWAIGFAGPNAALAQSREAVAVHGKPSFVDTCRGGAGPRRTNSDAQAGVASGDIVRVVVRSYETAAISAEINARIIRLPAREGDRFGKGDVIVEFDCSRIIAEQSAAIAILKAHRAIHENQVQMLKYKAAGSLAVDQARFEMEKAIADVSGLEAKRSSCTIHAPFDGRVTEKTAQVHEIAQPNQPLIRIVNASKLELVLMVPSAWLPRLREGYPFTVTIDETGLSHAARIVQSTGLIDPVSQSARLIAEIIELNRR